MKKSRDVFYYVTYDRYSGWITDKAKTNPGCIERFVCETYRTGESMTGFSYFFMQLTK